jgi:phosphoribosylanthranilate isomerase
MTSTRVKICGLTRPADRNAAVDAGADAVGVISDVAVETPREVTPERAADLVAGVPPFVTSVLVTMPDSVQDAVALQNRVRADAIQIHGTLSPAKLGGLRERVDAQVLAGVDAEDPELREYAAAADALLVDSTDEAGGGGTGETHDWTRTGEIAAATDTPVVLAGGLTPDNVPEAVETVEPFGVDTASGVEREGGIKDHDAVDSFVRRAKTAGSTVENVAAGGDG